MYDSDKYVRELIESGRFKEEDAQAIDIPFFPLESILGATNNFANANKLGQGGFGPVYKVIKNLLTLTIFFSNIMMIVGIVNTFCILSGKISRRTRNSGEETLKLFWTRFRRI